MIRRSDAGLHRWQEEVARDPGNPAFVPLADLYRAQGRLDVARRVCMRGLERHPNHVEAHYLLGRIHRDGGELEQAYDEWDIALSLDPHHISARRAIAFLCLERSDHGEAEKHLRLALANDPDDPRVRRAIRVIEKGSGAERPGPDFWEAASGLLAPAVERLSRGSRARLTLVIDSSGRVLAQHGFTRDLDLAGIASLAAGIQAASGEVARMLGQPRFTQHYQGRGENQLFIGVLPTPAGELLVLAVFGTDTTIGLVRAIFREMVDELGRAKWPAVGRTAARENLEADLAAGLRRAGMAAGRWSSVRRG